jgi:hypothetical protein
VKGTLDIDRYARIDVDAQVPQDLYRDPALLAPEKNVNFLKRCVQSFQRVNFADQSSGEVYLRIERGKVTLKCSAALELALRHPDVRAAIAAVAPEALHGHVADAPGIETLHAKDGAAPTLGQWGEGLA